MGYDLYSKFDIKQHEAHYTNYLEVVVLPDGSVEYAVPSHQEKLIAIGMRQQRLSRLEYEERCPREYWLDYMRWLLDDTGCIAVWSQGYSSCKNPTTAQINRLKEFKRHRIMRNAVV